jgi:hypothetical protein
LGIKARDQASQARQGRKAVFENWLSRSAKLARKQFSFRFAKVSKQRELFDQNTFLFFYKRAAVVSYTSHSYRCTQHEIVNLWQ